MLAPDQIAEEPLDRRGEDLGQHRSHRRRQVQPGHRLRVELVGHHIIHVGIDVGLGVQAEDANEGQSAHIEPILAVRRVVAAALLVHFQLRLDHRPPR